jgi:glycosyltransferase involved in cell wall biosynthesis
MLKIWPLITDRHRFVLYFQNHIPEDEFLRNPLLELKVVPGPCWLKKKRIVVEQLLMPGVLRRDKLDLYFATWYTAPVLFSGSKTVVAAWDISYSTHPEQYRLMDRIALSPFSRHACRVADGVITCSFFDGMQIERHYGIPRDRICVVQLAPEENFKPLSDPSNLTDLRKKYNLADKYILSLGVIYSRRNVDVIINAFKQVYDKYPDTGLVVIGRNRTAPFVDIQSMMNPLVQGGRGLYLPWLPEDELADMYRNAWWYICTSTCDGESVLLKEAMSCGTPVITSPMLKESVGDSAIIIRDPTSIAETTEVFNRVIHSQELRNKYSQEGLRWVKQFDWYEVARKSLGFLESR